MKSETKNVFGTIFTIIMMVGSMFANFAIMAPVAVAANGLGEVTQFQNEEDYPVVPPDVAVQTVGTAKDITIWIHNDEPVGGDCIDEIIVTFPGTWQNGISLSSTATNMGTVLLSNEADDGSSSGLVGNDNSLRIVPDYATDGVQLCPSGTTKITITGLTAPVNPEETTIMIMTSDQAPAHNEPSTSYVRQPIDVLPHILVTAAEGLMVRYVDFLSVVSGSSPADYTINAQAKGGWGRLNDLYVIASNPGMTVDVYVENSGVGLQTGTDYLIATMGLANGINTISMVYTGAQDVSGQMIDGFLKDSEQGGVPRNYYIASTGGAGTLQVVGHTDEDATETIDPTYSGTDFTNPPKEGTVLNVEQIMKRAILAQLVRDDGQGRFLDVAHMGVPIYFTTDKSAFVAGDVSPRLTDPSGQVEVRLEPGTNAGNAMVTLCFPDPLSGPECVNEEVAIGPGVPVSCAIKQGLDQTVEAGSIVDIVAQVYDQYGNLISNNGAPLVSFDITSAPPGADLDDDTTPPFTGDGDGFEQEVPNFGIADASLQTSTEVGDNVVNVYTAGFDCGTTTITGVLGQGDAITCDPVAVDADPEIAGAQITADQCFDVTIHVTDKNGNELPNWESIVELTLSATTEKTIVGSDLREEVIAPGGKSVKGKLNNNDPAYATVTVCGCEEFETPGTLGVMCKSDTLTDDSFTLDVINSAPSCIDVSTSGFDDCSPGMGQVGVSILDTCGNKLVDQECSEGGWASSCVKLQASCGVLSTQKTCVDLRNTGMAPLVDLDITGCGCPGVTVTAIDEEDCCDSVYAGTLPTCEPAFIGILGPVDYTTLNVFPEPENLQPDQFFVSERTVVELRQYDECNQLRECADSSVDLELEGEDCVVTDIQVDSPIDLYEEKCQREQGEIINEPLYKLVVENCAVLVKDGLEPAWTDLPEKNDIVVDKFAFGYSGSSSDTICIYEETEAEAGLQISGPTGDNSWGCRQLNSGDRVINLGGGDYIIELDTRVSMFRLGEYDNQRMGGAIVRPGDTKDFYFVLQSTSSCLYNDLDYQYFQDYSSPDWIEGIDSSLGLLDGTGGNIRDTIFGSESYTHRNDDYIGPDPYPVMSSTPDYGFGDRVLNNVPFINGVARAIFRDLVSEAVTVFADGMQQIVTFKTQPATQVVALNHDEQPQMACSDEGYDVNLQVTDGFQNAVGLATKVQLESCMTFPHYLYFKGTDGQQLTVNYWDHRGLFKHKDPRDVCFDMEEFKTGVEEIVNQLMDEKKIDTSDYLASIIAENTEFTRLIESAFDGKNVYFEGTTVDSYGHDVVYTDANGQAMFRVVSDDSSMFNMKWMDAGFRIFTIPVALDADYFDVVFTPGEPAKWDIIALPENGVPADGEQEAALLIRKLDACGNVVHVNEEVKVTAYSQSERAIISRDFSGSNNYDNEVTGSLDKWTCSFMLPWLEDCSLQLMNDVIEDVTVTVEDADCTATQDGICSGPTNLGCEEFETAGACNAQAAEGCYWLAETVCQQADSAMVKFVGAPRNLKITEIMHSDLLQADGFKYRHNLPSDSCDDEHRKRCSYDQNPEVCFQQCTQYGGSGAWVTVEVQDKYGNRVTGYLGDGLAGDPGDVYGLQDNIFENICVALDDKSSFIDDFTFGWLNLNANYGSNGGRVYCGDLAFGRGSVHVAYEMLDNGQPLDARQTESVVVSVFDKCDASKWKHHGFQSQPNFWDDECNGQEYNENNLPDSETASMLNSDYGQLDFVALADRWDINADKTVVAADGLDYAILTINTENQHMDVRTSIEATLQSSLLGSTLESESIKDDCYVEGLMDPLNPTSIIVNTEACSGGQAKIKLSSIKPGIARITVTGNNYGCTKWDLGDWEDAEFRVVPRCDDFGVIPMTPKTIEIQFKQSYQDNIELNEGWNFFSVPYDLATSNDQWGELGLDTICTASAYWNDAGQAWVAPVPVSATVDAMEGYWCKAASAATISITPMANGAVYLPPTKSIFAGWNDVGLGSSVEKVLEHALISIDSLYQQVYDWVEGLQRYNAIANTGELGGGNVPGTTGTSSMEAGQAYFIHASGAGEASLQ